MYREKKQTRAPSSRLDDGDALVDASVSRGHLPVWRSSGAASPSRPLSQTPFSPRLKPRLTRTLPLPLCRVTLAARLLCRRLLCRRLEHTARARLLAAVACAPLASRGTSARAAPSSTAASAAISGMERNALRGSMQTRSGGAPTPPYPALPHPTPPYPTLPHPTSSVAHPHPTRTPRYHTRPHPTTLSRTAPPPHPHYPSPHPPTPPPG